MFIKLWGLEIFAEIVPIAEKFIDRYNSSDENHFWFGPLHVVWNHTGEKNEWGKEDGITDGSPGNVPGP
jgi:hypothetical protein